jgi:hypothetical protein
MKKRKFGSYFFKVYCPATISKNMKKMAEESQFKIVSMIKYGTFAFRIYCRQCNS